MRVDNDAIFRQVFGGQVARVSDSVVGALTAALRRLRRRLVQDAGQQEKDYPHTLTERGRDDGSEERTLVRSR